MKKELAKGMSLSYDEMANPNEERLSMEQRVFQESIKKMDIQDLNALLKDHEKKLETFHYNLNVIRDTKKAVKHDFSNLYKKITICKEIIQKLKLQIHTKEMVNNAVANHHKAEIEKNE